MTGYLPSYVLLENTVNVLRSLVADSKGLVVAAHDPAAGLELLHNAPQQWRVIVGLDNEDSPEDISLKGVSNTEVFTMVQMPGGLGFDPGKQIYATSPSGGPSILEIAEAVRSWMRGLNLQHEAINCQIGFSWVSSSWVSTKRDENSPLVFARQHNFRIQHLIQPPADVEPTVIIHP